jgi:hypothetical protein
MSQRVRPSLGRCRELDGQLRERGRRLTDVVAFQAFDAVYQHSFTAVRKRAADQRLRSVVVTVPLEVYGHVLLIHTLNASQHLNKAPRRVENATFRNAVRPHAPLKRGDHAIATQFNSCALFQSIDHGSNNLRAVVLLANRKMVVELHELC